MRQDSQAALASFAQHQTKGWDQTCLQGRSLSVTARCRLPFPETTFTCQAQRQSGPEHLCCEFTNQSTVSFQLLPLPRLSPSLSQYSHHGSMQGPGNGTGALCVCRLSSWRRATECDVHSPAKQRNILSAESLPPSLQAALLSDAAYPATTLGTSVLSAPDPTVESFRSHLSPNDPEIENADLIDFHEVRWSDLTAFSGPGATPRAPAKSRKPSRERTQIKLLRSSSKELLSQRRGSYENAISARRGSIEMTLRRRGSKDVIQIRRKV